MEEAVNIGLSKVADAGLAFAVMVAMIAGEAWFIKYLLNEIKDSRLERTAETKESNKIITDLTVVLTGIKDTILHAINK